MFKTIFALCFLSVAFASNMPGKAVFWSHHDTALTQDSKTSYITKSVTASQINDFISQNSKSYEALAVLNLASGLSMQSVNNAFRNSKSKAAFVNVYQDKSQSSKSISGSLGHVVEKMSVSDFKKKCEDMSGIMANGKMDVVEVSVESEEDIKSLTHSSVLLAVYQEPASVAPEVKHEFQPEIEHEVKRSLASTTDLLYKPEGAEYSIYYADTYLYITPDIFTGLMTGLFMFFTILIGVSCLGNIQGMSTFYDKVPVVGKEA